MRLTPLFALGCYAFVSLGVSAALLGPALPTLADHAGVGMEQVGFIFTTMSLGYMASAPIISLLGPRIGTRNMLIVSPLLVMAAMALLALGTHMTAFFAATFLLGLGQAGTQVAYNAMFGQQQEGASSASGVLNRLNAFFGLGALIGPLFVALGYRLYGDATLAFWIAGAMALPLTLGALLAGHALRQRAAVEATQAVAPNARRDALLSPVMWILCAVMGLYVGSEVAFSGWTTEFTSRTTGVDTAQAAFTVSAFWAALALSRYFTTAFMRKVHPTTFIILLMLVSALGLIAMLLANGSGAVTLAGAFVVGLGFGPVYPTLIAIGIQRFPQIAQMVASLLTSAGSIGSLFLPTLTGVVLNTSGLGATSAWLLLLAALGVVMVLWLLARRDLMRHERPHTEHAVPAIEQQVNEPA
jgi:fucose permease